MLFSEACTPKPRGIDRRNHAADRGLVLADGDAVGAVGIGEGERALRHALAAVQARQRCVFADHLQIEAAAVNAVLGGIGRELQFVGRVGRISVRDDQIAALSGGVDQLDAVSRRVHRGFDADTGGIDRIQHVIKRLRPDKSMLADTLLRSVMVERPSCPKPCPPFRSRSRLVFKPPITGCW